jgi:tetratricopeptide (TPR) repeat protein
MPAAIEELLKKAQAQRGGPAAEALRKAAQLTREQGDLLGAVALYERAIAEAEHGPAEPRLRATIYLELGSLYETELGRIDQAMASYEKAFKVDPDNVHAIDAGRRVYRSLGDWPMVARLYEVELETASSRDKRGELLVALGRTLAEKLKDYGQAAVRLEEAVRLRQHDDTAKEALASLYVSPDFPSPADDEAQLERAAQLFVELADGRAARGDVDTQIAFLRRALGADPYHVEAATRLERAYLDAKRGDELRRFYRQGAPVPRRALKLAELALDAHDADEAMKAIVEATDEGDETALVVERLEELLASEKKWAQIAEMRERLLGELEGRDRADLLVDVATHWQRAGQADRFESSLLEALAADPVHPEAYQLLGEHLTQKRDYATLVGVAEQAVEAAPLADQPRRLAELADLYEKKLSDIAMAADAWRRAEALSPSPKGGSELKRLSQKQERWASMTAALEKELEGTRDKDARAEVLKRLGQVHRERHDLERARELWRDALELKPQDASIYRSLAELSEREGKQADVADTLRKQLRAAKEKVEKLNLLRRLAVLYDEKLHDLDGVEWACLEILEQLPGDRDALRRLEAAYERNGPEAEPRLIEVLETHAAAAATPAEKVPLLHRLAALYEKQGNAADAADRLERVVKLDKSDLGAQEALARLHEQLGKWAEAAMALERTLPRVPPGPEGVEPWKRFARLVDGKLGDAMRSAKAWKEVLDRRPTDKEALEGLTRLARARGDWALLDDVLERRQEHADGEQAVEVALERAQLADERLKNPARAIEILRHVLAEMDPRNLAAHTRLQKLLAASGDLDGSLRIAERELFLSDDPDRRLHIAVEIARRWDQVKDKRRAIGAWKRVAELSPTHQEALKALSDRYREVGDWEALLEIDERRLGLAQAGNANQEAIAILFELSGTAEDKLKDPERAFVYLRAAYEIDREPQTVAELRRMAERHSLWEEMCEVYSTQPGLESRLRVAEIADEKLRDPKRAFSVIRSSLGLDPHGDKLLPELERLSVRANDPAALLDVYEHLIARGSAAQRLDLLRRRAKVREERQHDASGALDEVVRAFPYAPADASLLAEVRRLAEQTKRWDDALAVEGYRFHQAPEEQRLAIACEAAAIVEEKVKDPLRAFRAYLRAFQLAPGDETIRAHLWRLARIVGEIKEEPKPPPVLRVPLSMPPPTPRAQAGAAGGGFVIESSKPAREPTLEVPLDDIMFDESRPHKLVASTEVVAHNEQRRDPTVELSINDLMTIARPTKAPPKKKQQQPQHKAPLQPPTMELSLSDIAVVNKGKGSNGSTPRRPAPPPPRVAPQTLQGPHLAWDELALVQLNLPAEDDQEHFRHLLAVSEMWEKGAGDLDKAFESLAGAFKLDPDNEPAREALQRLAESNGAWGQLVAVLDETIEETGNAERAVRLLIDSARVREKQGDMTDAEARYHRALGMRPDDEAAMSRLEAVYRQSERWTELATLLERRLHGLIERIPPSEARKLRALELADVYEKLGNNYEAIDAWTHVAREYPDHAPAFANLARLYEAVGQWSKVIESLTRELDVHDSQGKSGQEQARAIRRRIGAIFEKELELPERAIEAYGAVHDADPADDEATTALERLYEKLGRWKDLEALIGRKSERADREVRVALLERRAQILSERIGDHAGAAAVLRQLRKMHPEDDQIAARLERTLGRAGRVEEQAEVLRTRIRAAKRAGATKSELARMHVEVGLLEAQLGDAAGAERTLEKALELAPEDPRALAELAKLRQGGADWDGYATAREREAEVASSPAQAVAALVDAARVHMERRKDDQAAKKALERALQKDPEAAEAIALYGSLARRLLDDKTADQLAMRELHGEPPPAPERRAELHAGLGASALRRGEPDEAARRFREAVAAHAGYPPAIQGLADLAAQSGNWDEVEALLRDAAMRDGVPPQVASQFHRRLADAAEQQGRLDDAYTALLEADRLMPGDLQTRLLLGENRYRAHRYREAAQYLGALADHPDAERLPEEAAEAVYHGALAELKLRRADKAMPLLEAAVRIHPGHVAALGLLAERALEDGDVARGLELLELQAQATREPEDRAVRFERVADAILSELNDTARASASYDQAVAAAGDAATVALLEKALNLQRAGGKLEKAAETATRLLDRDGPAPERAKRLREAAALDAALGRKDQARERLQKALELDPLDHETLAGLSAMLVQEGRDDDAAQLLTRALPLLPPATVGLRAARASLWMRLGECRERLRDGRGAVVAFEKALEADPARRPLRELLLERYGDDPAHDEQVRPHRVMLIADEPLHAPSLRALARIDARQGARDGGRRFLELLAVAGQITDEERHLLSKAPPVLDEPGGTLDEDDHLVLAHAEALPLAGVFAALWEGTAAERAPGLDSVGASANDRVSPVAANELAHAYSLCARLLGNRKTGLYLKPDPEFTRVALVAQPPTAIVVGPSLTEGRSLADVRFLLGRALEIARPEYILAAALPPAEFTRLFAAILRAFHPRHARRRPDQSGDADEAAMWKRALPYKVAKRLAELFRDLANTEFSSHRWRRAVQKTGNRAGLVASGDIIAAARVLHAEGDRDGIEDLARFAAGDDYLALRTKLDGALTRR